MADVDEVKICDMRPFYKWLGDRHLFTQNMIEVANAIHYELRNGQLKEEEESYMIPDFDGGIARLLVPKCEACSLLSISFNDYQDCVLNLFKDDWDMEKWKVPFYVKSVPISRHISSRLCYPKVNKVAPYPGWKEEWPAMKQNWEPASTCQRLKTLIEKHGDRLKNVDRVVCFALGNLQHDKKRSYIQHLAASTIRDTINALPTRGELSPVSVLAQDPAYCGNCTEVISELDIETTTGYEGFLKITENTFVFCVAPSAPILQIIADITTESGKPPLAILCDAIGDTYLEFDEKKRVQDMPTKRLVELKAKYEEEEFSDFPTDIEFNGKVFKDKEDYMRSYVVPAKVKKEYPNESEEKQEELKKQAQMATRKAFESNFGDLKLYVKKGE